MRNVTVIAPAKVLAIATKLGLTVLDKKGEIKVHGPSGKAKSLAIPKTKGGATRIYAVGFEPAEGFVAHPKPPAKTVTVMLDHTASEKECLRACFKALKSLVGEVKAEPVAPKAGESVEEPAAPSVEEAKVEAA